MYYVVNVVKAMVLCAGYGRRLWPITEVKPKGLLYMSRGFCLLELVINRLKFFGFDELVINVHYLYEEVVDFLCRKGNFGIDIRVSHEREGLLGTGGAIRHARDLLCGGGGSFLLCNVDILSDLDLGLLYRSHESSGVLVTLAVQDRECDRGLFFDNDFMLCGWKGAGGILSFVGGVVGRLYSFSGVHIISLEVLDLIEEDGIFSIIELYLRLSGCGYGIRGYDHSGDYCIDVGTFSGLREASFLGKGILGL